MKNTIEKSKNIMNFVLLCLWDGPGHKNAQQSPIISKMLCCYKTMTVKVINSDSSILSIINYQWEQQQNAAAK